MSKNVNWDAMYKGTLRGLRAPKGASYSSRRELVQQSMAKLQKAEKEAADFQRLEPHLKKSLMAHMLSRTPILVVRPMAYFTEELPQAKPMDEIDRAFYKSDQQSQNIGQFEIVQKPIEPGTELVFQGLNSSLGQWIFKSSTGETIEIYDKPVITLGRDRVVQNPGFWGLLTCTNIYSDLVGSEIEDSEE